MRKLWTGKNQSGYVPAASGGVGGWVENRGAVAGDERCLIGADATLPRAQPPKGGRGTGGGAN